MTTDTAAQTPDAQGLVLWAGTVRSSSVMRKVEAASRLGYSALSLSPSDYRSAQRSEIGQDLVARIADAGLYVSCLDPYTRWLPEWDPPSASSPAMLDFIGTGEREFFEAAEALGARSMTVFEPFGRSWPTEVLADAFARICARARESGIRVNLEFIPFLGIPDLATAWHVVQLSGDPDAGIVLDTWHYFRGTPSNDLLRSIPGTRIGAVQVSDAHRSPVHDLETDCLHHRLLAGDGAFPLHDVLDVLRASGGLNDVGPEIFSDVLDQYSGLLSARLALTGMSPWQAAMAASPSGEAFGDGGTVQ